MRRRKHKNDVKANTHWERWRRAKNYHWSPFRHSDWRLEGLWRKRKIMDKILKRELNG